MLAHSSYTPDSANADNGTPIITGVHFIVLAPITCTSIDFRVPTTNTGTYTGALHQATSTNTGTLLSSGTLAAGSTSGGADASITLASPQSLVTGVVYVAAVHSSSGRYVAKSNGLLSEITGNNVTLVAFGTDPNPPGLGSLNNGLFNDAPSSSTAYPTQTFNKTDYGVDIGAAATITGTMSATLPGVTGSIIGTTYGTLTATLPRVVGVLLSADATPATPRGRGFEDLISILDNNRAMKTEDDARLANPVYCPNDQVTLISGWDGTLYCPYDGWRAGR